LKVPVGFRVSSFTQTFFENDLAGRREKHAELPHRSTPLIEPLSRILGQCVFIEDSVQETAAFRTPLKGLFAFKEGAAIIATQTLVGLRTCHSKLFLSWTGR